MARPWLTNSAYIDETGALHIDVPMMLKEMGVADTQATRAACAQLAAEILAELLKNQRAVIKITE